MARGRWHPDKIQQRFGERLNAGGEREAVLAEVNAIARQINTLRERVKRRMEIDSQQPKS